MLKYAWIDRGREPQEKPNPEYPHGMHIDFSMEGYQSCSIVVPYPAPRCGIYIIECEKCGITVGATTAGRPDDPRMFKLACGRNPEVFQGDPRKRAEPLLGREG